MLTAKLTEQGAAIFAKILKVTPWANELIESGAVKLIFAPVDELLADLLAQSGKSFDDFIKLPSASSLIMNHLYRSLDRQSPILTAINGFQLKADRESMKLLAPVTKFVIGDLNVVVIGNVIVDQQGLEVMAQPQAQNIVNQMGFEGTRVLIRRGQLKGRDLIGLCLSDRATNDFCNRVYADGKTIFHELMLSEFNSNLPADADARALYIFYHQETPRFYIEVDPAATNTTRQGLPATGIMKLDDNFRQVIRAEDYYGLTFQGDVYQINRAGQVKKLNIGERVAKLAKQTPLSGVVAVTDEGNYAVFSVAYPNTTLMKLQGGYLLDYNFNDETEEITALLRYDDRLELYRGSDKRSVQFPLGTQVIPLNSRSVGYVLINDEGRLSINHPNIQPITNNMLKEPLPYDIDRISLMVFNNTPYVIYLTNPSGKLVYYTTMNHFVINTGQVIRSPIIDFIDQGAMYQGAVFRGDLQVLTQEGIVYTISFGYDEVRMINAVIINDQSRSIPGLKRVPRNGIYQISSD